MLVLVTDFGLSGPYVGQMIAVLKRQAPGVPVVNLFSDAPVHNPRATAYLLAAYIGSFPEKSTFLTVVDPGVGSGKHRPVIVEACDRWFVGPDNGLFNVIVKRATQPVKWREIIWRPPQISASFHGRDLYAPVAARVATGDLSAGKAIDRRGENWPDDLFEIIYVDHFGNAVTGVRALSIKQEAILKVADTRLRNAHTFASVKVNEPFWYENSNGLVEIAINQGHAAEVLGLVIGSPIVAIE